jgi:uncharacterized protein YndB with AHSA1/START domain
MPTPASPAAVWAVVSRIGGDNGYFYLDGLWRLRELMDWAVGGNGLEHHRRHPTEVVAGDRIDSWTVLGVEPERRLSLQFGMKAPGSGVLEFELSPRADGGTEPVAHGVLDPQGREFQAAQRRADRVHVHADRAVHAETRRPVLGVGRLVHVLLAAVGRLRDAPQDPRPDAALEVRRVAGREVAAEVRPAAGRADLARAAGGELRGERRLEAARAGGEVRLRAHGGSRRIARSTGGECRTSPTC